MTMFGCLACSRDGTVRLWDCGESKCLAIVSKCNCPVNGCALASVQDVDLGKADERQSEYSLQYVLVWFTVFQGFGVNCS